MIARTGNEERRDVAGPMNHANVGVDGLDEMCRFHQPLTFRELPMGSSPGPRVRCSLRIFEALVEKVSEGETDEWDDTVLAVVQVSSLLLEVLYTEPASRF